MGWHSEPEASELVQSPAAPFVGAPSRPPPPRRAAARPRRPSRRRPRRSPAAGTRTRARAPSLSQPTSWRLSSGITPLYLCIMNIALGGPL